ncbi:MAG: sulfatase-like hydrolase/transferase [Saprospiraceae bacterium]|nr:sulfatase-like hydrolase/transferase [Saprospiraceae bacterium]
MLYKNQFLCGCVLLLSTIVTGQSGSNSRTSAEALNYIFILTDDQSYGSMGCTGNEWVQTPNLDQLAADGTLFTNAHVTSAICTPSRASIFLSQFERRHGVNFNSGTSVAPEAWAKSYPVQMRKAGYYTGYIGKNHTPIGAGGYDSGVMEESFDYWYAGHGHLTFYPKSRHDIFKGAKVDTQVEVMQEGMVDFLDPNQERLAGAVQFLEERPTEQPFVLSLCFNLPHSASTRSMEQRPTDPEIYRSLYRNLELPLPEHYVAKADIQEPKLPMEILHAEDRQTGYDFVDEPATLKERYTRQLQAMTGIDQLVGELRSRLEKLGIAEKTVLVFTSDHGLFMGQFGLGGKALCYEQVTHVPLIIYHPGLTPEERPATSHALVQTIDIAPTLLSLANIPIPSSMQGKDLSKVLGGKEKTVREFLLTENLWSTKFGNPRCESIQNMEWKYIRYYKNENQSALNIIRAAKDMKLPLNKLLYQVNDQDIALYRSFAEAPFRGEKAVYEELFQLSKDPQETTNLIQQASPSLLKEMRQALDEALYSARGTEAPKVLRYTQESKLEAQLKVKK